MSLNTISVDLLQFRFQLFCSAHLCTLSSSASLVADVDCSVLPGEYVLGENCRIPSAIWPSRFRRIFFQRSVQPPREREAENAPWVVVKVGAILA